MIFDNKGFSVSHSVAESTDDTLILEGALIDGLSNDEMQAFLESSTDVNTALTEEVVTEKTIVRLDRKAQISQARKAAVFTIARERNDVKMKKLMTIWRMERRLEGELDKKYGNEAERRAKKAVDQRRKSKSATVSRAAKNAKKVLNAGLPSNRIK